MSKTWDEVISFLNVNFNGSRYETNAHGLVPVAEQLKHHPVLNNLKPGISLINLTLSVPKVAAKIYVWCEKPASEYVVYIYDETGSHDEISVATDKLIDVLSEYAKKLDNTAY
jgi:hypothetical protein